MRSFTFRVFMNRRERHDSDCSVYTTAGVCDGEKCVRATTHDELGTYESLPVPPWVPPVGSFFRFRDPYPPKKEPDHAEKKGRVKEIVTCFYGTTTVIEVYLDPV